MNWVWAIAATLVFIGFGSCRKSSAGRAALEGRWELQYEQSGRMPAVNYPADNNNHLIFKNNTYKLVTNGHLVKSGTYTLAHDASVASEVCLVVPTGEFEDRLIFDNNRLPKTYIQLSNQKLQVLSGCFAADAGTYQTYVKQAAAD